MSDGAGEAVVRDAAPARRGAVAFIFVTILLDMVALGVIMPVLGVKRGCPGQARA